MSKVSAVDFGNVVLVEVANHVTATEQSSNEAIAYFSRAFGKPVYLVSKVSNRSVRYRGQNRNILRQLQQVNPYNLRWSQYRIG